MDIILQAPIWFLPLCLLCGALFSMVLYLREKNTELTATMKKVLAGIRFITVSLMALLLMAPLVRTSKTIREKPLIILAQDNSASLNMGSDSLFYRGAYLASLRRLEETLGAEFDVRTMTFGDQVKEGLDVQYAEAETDLSGFLEDFRVRFANRNVGALVLATDGLYNRGANPLYIAENIPFPIYTVAMGDTNIRKDIIVREVNYNKVSYLGNSFPVEVVVRAQKCKGISSTLKVSRNGQLLYSKPLVIGDADYLETVSLMLEARSSGLQHYRVEVLPVAGELTTANNVRDIYVDVLDARQKILILGSAPHPDQSALKQSLETITTYEVETGLIRDFNKPIDAYHLVVLHQLPGRNQSLPPAIGAALGTRVPVLYMLGLNSDLAAFNNRKTGLLIMQGQQRWDEAQAVFNTGFSMFTLGDESLKIISEAPPLTCPFGDYRLTPGMTSLFYQRIGKVATSRPLMAFSQGMDVRTGVICGEGLFKWRLYNYLQTGSHDAFNELAGKIIQFLSIRADKSLFRVYGKNRYASNEAVEFTAELYNESYEMINSSEVRLQLTDQRGKKIEYLFSRTQSAYHLNMGVLPVGDYTWVAQAKAGTVVHEQKGAFSVQPVNKESLQLVADHALLAALAGLHGGAMIDPHQVESLADSIRQREDIKTITYKRETYSDLINVFWVLMLIIALLTTEWILRKRGGAI